MISVRRRAMLRPGPQCCDVSARDLHYRCASPPAAPVSGPSKWLDPSASRFTLTKSSNPRLAPTPCVIKRPTTSGEFRGCLDASSAGRRVSYKMPTQGSHSFSFTKPRWGSQTCISELRKVNDLTKERGLNAPSRLAGSSTGPQYDRFPFHMSLVGSSGLVPVCWGRRDIRLGG